MKTYIPTHLSFTLSFPISTIHMNSLIISLAASSDKHNVTVWRPSVCLSDCLLVCPIFSNLNRARGANSTWLTRGHHAMRRRTRC